MNDDIILKGLADNQPMVEALLRKFEAKFQASLKDLAGLPVEQAGQFAKTRVEGMKLVDEVFKEIGRLKAQVPPVDRPNPAR
jgi:hypothetical protein